MIFNWIPKSEPGCSPWTEQKTLSIKEKVMGIIIGCIVGYLFIKLAPFIVVSLEIMAEVLNG